MTSSAAFRCVQAWLLEKPAAWADEDAPCLAAALMAQRPPCDMQRKRPREDALLEAERSHQRHLIAQLDWELLGETQCRMELERENRNLRRRVGGLNDIIDRSQICVWSHLLESARCDFFRCRSLFSLSRKIQNGHLRPGAPRAAEACAEGRR